MLFFFCWGLALRGQEFESGLFRNRDVVEVPFQYINGFIVLNVKYGKLPDLKFIFDTGAEYSLMSYRELALLGGARIGRKVKVYGADLMTRIDANVIYGNHLVLGDRLGVRNLDMILLNSDYLSFEKYVGFVVHGIIGANVFSNFVVEIDYTRQVLKFHNPDSYHRPPRGFSTLPLAIHSRKPYVPLEVTMPSGKVVQADFLLDTGAGLSLLILLGSHEDLTLPENVLLSRIASGLGGNMEGYLGRVRRIKIGKYNIESPVIHFQNLPDTSLVPNFSRMGIIGNRMLSGFRVIIDYPHKRLYLKAKKRRKNLRYDKSGITVIASGPRLNRLTIGQVLLNTPAYEAGLQEGDIVLKLNGLPAKFRGIDGINRLLTGKEGKRIKVKIKRGDEKKTFRFRLHKYL